MRILLVSNYLKDGQESMQRFAALMLNGLLDAGHEVRVISPPMLAGRLKSSNQGMGKWLGYVDKFALFPPLLLDASRWADVVHICDHSNAMYAAWTGSAPCLVTCHDMLAVRGALSEQTDCPASRTGKYLQRWIVHGLHKANSVVCVSKATLVDFERIVGRSTSVILNSLNYPYHRISPDRCEALLSRVPQLDLAKPFVLHVGSNSARKNKNGVIRAFAKATATVDLQLVLAGPQLNSELNELIRDLGVADRVIVVVKPCNEMLEGLYNKALGLLFPSRFEGFGWPLIEAQACGCPVICSRCAPFSEIVGESAIMREVDDESGFAADLSTLANDSSERARWVQKGLRNAVRFSRELMISAYIDRYKELVQTS
ncbi:MAG: glycosyltransferase family 1 protein [Acidobacteria bacterium]|nr:MAG: glycosyltransferase family 1 protein [Acidobacteriota bacterium]